MWLAIITIASLISFTFVAKSDPIQFEHTDKIVHAFFYFTLTLLFYLHFRKSGKSRILLKVSLFSLTYGIIIEVLQYVMPYHRAFELMDIIANTTGIFMAIVLIKLGLNRKAGEKRKF